jgi:molybdopterin-guanine dinucleotide biosynthesis protein A
VIVFSIAILCGGRSKRFGSKKVFHKVNGKTILQRVYDKFKNKTDDIFLQISNDQECQDDFTSITLDLRPDLVSDAGPLGGLYSAIKHAKHVHVFIVAGDLPFIDEGIVKILEKSLDHRIIVPQWNNGYLEPLCAVYSKDVLPVIEYQLKNNDLKISNLYKKIEEDFDSKFRIKYLNINELIKHKKLDLDCFRNINTINDLESKII